MYPDLSARPEKLVVERDIETPPETVYRAWTRDFDHWFAAEGTLSMQPRVGAPYFFETHFEGGRHPHYGRFLALVPNERVEMTWMTGDPGTRGAETVVTLEIMPNGTGSRIRLTHAGFCDEASRKGHEEAWPMVFNHLDEQLAR